MLLMIAFVEFLLIPAIAAAVLISSSHIANKPYTSRTEHKRDDDDRSDGFDEDDDGGEPVDTIPPGFPPGVFFVPIRIHHCLSASMNA